MQARADGAPRRSGRRIITTESKTAESTTKDSLQEDSAQLRRNPKRKAGHPKTQLPNLPDNLLDEALKPLTRQDIDEWEGWVELESEPAFFNTILHDLGVNDVKAQEIFTIDQSSLDTLPQPVHGLIFLFQYTPTHEESASDDDDETGSLWFANQTTNNACATVALLNIVMNARHVELGERLREFKESTKSLSTVMRGYQLSKNGFIRSIHNSFMRRMDQLNADLCLENEASDTKTKRVKTRSGNPTKKGSRSLKRARDDWGFHFIAYVPADGYVWELDGLRSKPNRIGPIDYDEAPWTSVARPQIEARILQHGESQLSFNLLALCQSPLSLHCQSIAGAVASLLFVERQMKDKHPNFADLVGREDAVLDVNSLEQLSEFRLRKSDIENAEIPDSLRQLMLQPSNSLSDAYQLHQQLVVSVKVAIGEFRSEIVALAEDDQRVAHRKKDYSSALHKWVQRLAEKDVLEHLIMEES